LVASASFSGAFDAKEAGFPEWIGSGWNSAGIFSLGEILRGDVTG
jgi:hypothetical protein